MIAALAGVSVLAVQLDENKASEDSVWNGDISGFKKGDYTSLPEIALAKKENTVKVTGDLEELSSGNTFGKFGEKG